VVAVDGGRLKLEWDALPTRSGRTSRMSVVDGERLLGFLGIYTHGRPPSRWAGMVDPAVAAAGIGPAPDGAGYVPNRSVALYALLAYHTRRDRRDRSPPPHGGIDHAGHSMVGAPCV